VGPPEILLYKIDMRRILLEWILKKYAETRIYHKEVEEILSLFLYIVAKLGGCSANREKF
jgi:hypothetical protein